MLPLCCSRGLCQGQQVGQLFCVLSWQDAGFKLACKTGEVPVGFMHCSRDVSWPSQQQVVCRDYVLSFKLSLY